MSPFLFKLHLVPIPIDALGFTLFTAHREMHWLSWTETPVRAREDGGRGMGEEALGGAAERKAEARTHLLQAARSEVIPGSSSCSPGSRSTREKLLKRSGAEVEPAAGTHGVWFQGPPWWGVISTAATPALGKHRHQRGDVAVPERGTTSSLLMGWGRTDGVRAWTGVCWVKMRRSLQLCL